MFRPVPRLVRFIPPRGDDLLPVRKDAPDRDFLTLVRVLRELERFSHEFLFQFGERGRWAHERRIRRRGRRSDETGGLGRAHAFSPSRRALFI